MFSQQQLTRWLTVTSFIAVLIAYGVIGFGALTRLTDAGLGCPDWPACYGHWMGHTVKAQTEMGHRYLAGTLGLLMMLIAFLCALSARYLGLRFLFFALGLVALFVYQALLGMWTVTMQLWPVVVTQHLLIGMLILCLFWLIFLNARQQERRFFQSSVYVYTPNIRFFSVITFIVLFAQMILGGWTSSNYAGLICHGFPACHATNILSYDFKNAFRFTWVSHKNYDGGAISEAARMTIQLMHRFGALIVGILLGVLILWIHQFYANNKRLLRASRYLLFFFCVQIVLGILNVTLQLPITIAVLHNIMAATLLLTTVTINYCLFLER